VAKVGTYKAGGTISQQAAVHPWLAADAHVNKQKLSGSFIGEEFLDRLANADYSGSQSMESDLFKFNVTVPTVLYTAGPEFKFRSRRSIVTEVRVFLSPSIQIRCCTLN
jgi:hypothetical protein